jgi:hypothetical protein
MLSAIGGVVEIPKSEPKPTARATAIMLYATTQLTSVDICCIVLRGMSSRAKMESSCG